MTMSFAGVPVSAWAIVLTAAAMTATQNIFRSANISISTISSAFTSTGESGQHVFHGQYVERLDRRRACQHLVHPRHQALCHVAGEVRLAAFFTREGVEHAERVRREPEGEPDWRGGLLIRHFQAGGKEVRYRLLLSGFGFKSDK